jgi:hypothetical protein
MGTHDSINRGIITGAAKETTSDVNFIDLVVSSFQGQFADVKKKPA